MVDDLLPANATPLERALSRGTAGMVDIASPARLMWDAARIPAAYLPWLAWSLSVDDWDPDWPDDRKREVILGSVQHHRTKGTVGSMRRALAATGYGDAQIVERYGTKFYDGTLTRDGSSDRTAADHWAEYRVILTRPISLAQAARARAILQSTAPARCRLKAMDFREARLMYGDRAPRDGSYSRGIA